MKYLKTFESFNTDLTIDFIYGRITESEFISYLESINENWISDTYERVKWKVIEYVWTFLQEAIKLGFKIFNKVVTFFKWIWNKIKSFKEKNPVLFKVITITIIIFLLLIIFASVAHAQTTGTPIDETHIKMAIGLLEDMRGRDSLSNSDINSTIEYLNHLRKVDGVVSQTDVVNFGEKTTDLAKVSIDTVKKFETEAIGGDKTAVQYCQKILSKGTEVIMNLNTKQIEVVTKSDVMNIITELPNEIIVQSESPNLLKNRLENKFMIEVSKSLETKASNFKGVRINDFYDIEIFYDKSKNIHTYRGTLKKF